MAKPELYHFKAAQHVLTYLRDTDELDLVYKQEVMLAQETLVTAQTEEEYTSESGQSVFDQFLCAAVVPGVRADGLRGLAGRGRGYPRVSSGSDTVGDTIPASSGRYTRTSGDTLDRPCALACVQQGGSSALAMDLRC